MLVLRGVERDRSRRHRRGSAQALASGAGVEKLPRDHRATRAAIRAVVDDYARLPSAPDRDVLDGRRATASSRRCARRRSAAPPSASAPAAIGSTRSIDPAVGFIDRGAGRHRGAGAAIRSSRFTTGAGEAWPRRAGCSRPRSTSPTRRRRRGRSCSIAFKEGGLMATTAPPVTGEIALPAAADAAALRQPRLRGHRRRARPPPRSARSRRNLLAPAAAAAADRADRHHDDRLLLLDQPPRHRPAHGRVGARPADPVRADRAEDRRSGSRSSSRWRPSSTGCSTSPSSDRASCSARSAARRCGRGS